MADTDLPEGTDMIIDDASRGGIGEDAAPTTRASGTSSNLTRDDIAAERAPSSNTVRDALKGGSDKLRSTASDRAMGFLGQGIERSSGALTNVSQLIGETATSIDERLGSQYGDYARQAASALERAAGSLANKAPDELVDDARTLIRKSPGIALAGAAILGFALVRVVKSGLDGSPGESRPGSSK